MTKHQWNNMLHNQIEKIFVTTIESDSHVLRKKVSKIMLIYILLYILFLNSILLTFSHLTFN